MRKVMVFGSFDVLHDGHRYLFHRAKQYADELVVVVARDYNYNSLRGYEPIHDETERLNAVLEESLVDKAILGEKHDVYAVIRRERPAVICLGYDQEFFIDGLRSALEESNLSDTKIIRIDPYKPDELKSSILKRSMGGK